ASGERGILAISPHGAVHEPATGWAGGPFRGPNDLCFRPNGDLYFTDPKGSSPDHPIGNVFILRHTGDVERFADGFQFPHGLVFSDDGATLYLAETYPSRIWAFDVDEYGRERSRRVFAQLEAGSGPDGIALDQDGNLYAARYGKGGVAVIDPAGQVIAELPTYGQHPTNLAFWDGSLYVTEVEHGQVVRLDIGVAGQVLYGLGPLHA
ncbi:MAG: SMP-30/gluconolactonase/LRE family protein, partial [Nitrososphaerales archaeon]